MPTARADTYSAASGGGIFAGANGNARVAIWGQSNAVGRSERSEIAESPLSADAELAAYDAGTFARVWIWTGSAYTQLQPSVFTGPTNNAGQFGAEFGLAVRWMRERATGHLYIDKNCDGALSITEFAPPSSTWYANGTTERGQADAWLGTAGVSIALEAMLWIQGEQDAAQSQAWYETRLSDMVAAARSDGIIGAASVVVLSQMHPSTSTYGAGVAAAKTAYADANPSIVTELGMPYYVSDNIHLSGRGMVQHGYDAFRAIFGGEQINV